MNKASAFLPGSNLPASYSTTLTAANTNVYSAQSMSWQGTLLTGYTLTSAWEGSGTSYAAAYDADAHVMAFSAAPVNLLGAASQQINEGYTFTLENLSTVNATNSLGVNIASTYNYADSTSRERVTSMTTPNAPTADYYAYDRRGRGLITQHKLTTTQNPAQDAYEYDSLNRLISISHLGVKQEDLAYDGLGELISRQFTNGTDTARYYVGDELTGVIRNPSTKIGYVHIRLGTLRIASFWIKAVGTSYTNGLIYYHRNDRGDIVATTTNGGRTGISYRYLPSGTLDKMVGAEDDTNTSELGFIGGLRLSNNLVQLKARVYSPALRRFLQPDTIDLRRYTYTHGDFVNFVDPSGRYEGEPGTSAKVINEEGNSSSPEGPQSRPSDIGPLTPIDVGPTPGPTVEINPPLALLPNQAPALQTPGAIPSASTATAPGVSLACIIIASKDRWGPIADTLYRDALNGGGRVIVRTLRSGARLAADYGGVATDWVKMGSKSLGTGVRGWFEQVQLHWYRNLQTGMNVEFKFKSAFQPLAAAASLSTTLISVPLMVDPSVTGGLTPDFMGCAHPSACDL